MSVRFLHAPDDNCHLLIILFQYVKIARLTDAEDGDKVSSSCMELGNEMEVVGRCSLYSRSIKNGNLLQLHDLFCLVKLVLSFR